MSADNGIYILESTTDQGTPEYRVTEAMAIENLNYVPASTHEPEDEEFWNLTELWKYFGRCQVYRTEDEAYQQARQLYRRCMDDFGVCEYGICTTKLPRGFPTKAEVLTFARLTVDRAFQTARTGDQPLTGRNLVALQMALNDCLGIMAEFLVTPC